jgi:hypothetical protein
MQYGSEPQHCARCGAKLDTSVVYEDGMFWHRRCLQEGQHLLANAERIARSLNPALLIHEQRQPE